MKSEIGYCVWILFHHKYTSQYPRKYWKDKLRRLIYNGH